MAKTPGASGFYNPYPPLDTRRSVGEDQPGYFPGDEEQPLGRPQHELDLLRENYREQNQPNQPQRPAPPTSANETRLSASDEKRFRNWLQLNNLPIAPEGYDMRGLFKAYQAGSPWAIEALRGFNNTSR